MYLVNDRTTDGLVNGARGTVMSFSYAKNRRTVTCVTVKFDNILQPQNVNRIDKMFMPLNRCYVHRKQFPLVLAYGVTIHKSQSLSLPCVFADLGDSIFCAGQSNVALSRCMTLEGLHLLNFNPKKVTCSNRAVKHQADLMGVPVDELPHNKSKGAVRDRLERVWYTKASVSKAKSAMKSNLSNESESAKKSAGRTTPRSNSKADSANSSGASTSRSKRSGVASQKQTSTVDHVIDVDSIPEQRVVRAIDVTQFKYYPVNSDWQKKICDAFGWTYVGPSAPASCSDPVTINQLQRPIVQVSIKFSKFLNFDSSKIYP